MNFFETLERIQRLHKLIETANTGNPDQLSKRLGICRKTLYNMIDELRSHNAPIEYSKKKETFYYARKFELTLNYRVSIIEDEDMLEKISGGMQLFRSVYFFTQNYPIFAIKVKPVNL